MNTQQWLDYATKHQHELMDIIGKFHPVMKTTTGEFKITAPNAEAACEKVRVNIRQNFEGHPVKQFTDALEFRDVTKINNLLNDTWFGVPESTSCWSIPGFRELVHLVEEPPTEEE